MSHRVTLLADSPEQGVALAEVLSRTPGGVRPFCFLPVGRSATFIGAAMAASSMENPGGSLAELSKVAAAAAKVYLRFWRSCEEERELEDYRQLVSRAINLKQLLARNGYNGLVLQYLRSFASGPELVLAGNALEGFSAPATQPFTSEEAVARALVLSSHFARGFVRGLSEAPYHTAVEPLTEGRDVFVSGLIFEGRSPKIRYALRSAMDALSLAAPAALAPRSLVGAARSLLDGAVSGQTAFQRYTEELLVRLGVEHFEHLSRASRASRLLDGRAARVERALRPGSTSEVSGGDPERYLRLAFSAAR